MVKRAYIQVGKIIEDLPKDRQFTAYDLQGLFVDLHGTSYAPNTTTISYYLRQLIVAGKVKRIKEGWYISA
jgi:hypothetical protein